MQYLDSYPELSSELDQLADRVKGLLSDPAAPQLPFQSLGNSLTPRAAAKVVQRAWRKSRLSRRLFSREDGHASYRQILAAQNDRQNLIADLMFGRNIAASDDPQFPHNPDVRNKSLYHRDDPILKAMSHSAIVQKFDPNVELDQYIYFPINKISSYPLSEILATYLNDAAIAVLELPNEKISLLKFPKEPADKSQHCIAVLAALGIKASLWELAIFYSRHCQDPNASTTETDPAFDLAQLNSGLDKTIQQLKKISFGNYPTKLLARSLCALIQGLAANNDNQAKIMDRILMFANFAASFYKNNYEKFSICIYGCIHEISQLIYDKKINDESLISYQEFSAETLANATAAFGELEIAHLSTAKYAPLALPALSGMNAYALAVRLAKKMRAHDEAVGLKLAVIDEGYFETKFLEESTVKKISYSDLDSSTEIPDVLFVTSSQIVQVEGLAPGIIINELIKKLGPDRIKEHPLTLVIDATSGLYRSLNLDPESLELVKEGKLSLIANESHQKFALLHTDQAQYGRVFGILSTDSFAPEVLEEFTRNAEQDFAHCLDMQIGAYLNCRCGKILERIKELHFTNSKIFAQINPQLSPLNAAEEPLFLLIKDGVAEQIILDQLPTFANRDSFGHYAPNITSVGDLVRICPNSSDQIDALIHALQLFLIDFDEGHKSYIMRTYALCYSNFTTTESRYAYIKQSLSHIFQDLAEKLHLKLAYYIQKIGPDYANRLNLEEELIFTAILMNILVLPLPEKQELLDDLFTALFYFQAHSSLHGRKCYQILSDKISEFIRKPANLVSAEQLSSVTTAVSSMRQRWLSGAKKSAPTPAEGSCAATELSKNKLRPLS